MCACQFASTWLKKPMHFQFGRFIAYSIGGALAGGLSSNVFKMITFGIPVFQALHWMLMALLLFSSLLLLWRGQSIGTLVNHRIHLPPMLERKLNRAQNPSGSSSIKAGLLWLLMPCGVLWASLMLAYLSGSPIQGALLMAMFALSSGIGLHLANQLRQSLSNRLGETLMMRTSGGLLLLGLAIMAGRQLGWLPTPLVLQSLGLCL
jgi:sulfite exporter TauE/SafE